MTAPLNPQALENYLRTARIYKVPPDALRNFQIGGYLAQPKQLQFHAAARLCDLPDGPTQVGFGGARGPGKSHALFAQVALDDCQRISGLKVLYLRKVAKNAREQFEDLRRAVLRYVEHQYRRQEGIVIFPNGSRIIIGHFKNESDIDSYLGLEYDIICIEEATTLTESKYKTLRDSNRTSKPGFRPRIYCSTNPGGIGHGWFKKRFIEPARSGNETDTRFIFATVDDNAFIDADYKKKLEENTGWRLKAYRWGDWDIAAGQFFSNWRYEAIVKPLGSPMPHQLIWCSLDYGFIHPTVCYLLGAYDGKIQVFDEYRAVKCLPDENAREILRMLARHGVYPHNLQAFVAGRDVFAQKGDSQGKTIAEQYEENGITLTPANDDRIQGWAELLRLFGDVDRKPNPKMPLIEISERCVNLIQCIPNLQHNPNRPEDVLKRDANEEGEDGDDEGDCFIAGTLVTTIKGQKPIEQIKDGELVLTREGFKPVLSAWKKKEKRTVLNAEFSDGTLITGTPNHPFWVKGKGFVFLDSLRYGDIMETVWQNPKLLNSTALNSAVIQTQNAQTIEAITTQAEIILSEACRLCTSKFGSQSTEKFRQAVMSIIKTEIRSTTTSKILNALRRSNIGTTINHPPTRLNLRDNILIKSDRLPLNGIHRPKDWSGAGSMEKKFGETGREFQNLASSAAKAILRLFLSNPAFARINAKRNGDATPDAIMSPSHASDAAKNLSPTNTNNFVSVQKPAQPVRLLSLAENDNKTDVYALFVADCHEYYANNILVKNCIRYGVMEYSKILGGGGSFRSGVPLSV